MKLSRPQLRRLLSEAYPPASGVSYGAYQGDVGAAAAALRRAEDVIDALGMEFSSMEGAGYDWTDLIDLLSDAMDHVDQAQAKLEEVAGALEATAETEIDNAAAGG